MKHMANISDIASTQTYFIVIYLIEPNILRINGESKSLRYVRAIKLFQKNVGEAVIVKDSNPIVYRLLESAYNKDRCTIPLVEDRNLINTKGSKFTVVFTIESA